MTANRKPIQQGDVFLHPAAPEVETVRQALAWRNGTEELPEVLT